MKLSRLLVASATVALVLGAGLPASASDDTDLQLAAEYEETVAKGTWVDQDGYVRLSPEQLRKLDRSQSQADTQRIVDSGKPVNMLVDADTGAVLAAQYAEQVTGPTTMAITDCVSGGSIIKRTNQGVTHTYCYIGSGTRTVSIVGTYYASAGSSNIWFTLYFTNGTSSTLLHGSSITLSTPKTTNKIERGYHS